MVGREQHFVIISQQNFNHPSPPEKLPQAHGSSLPDNDWPFLRDIKEWYLNSLESGGYPLIALLMAIESSFFPLPSEFVILPAAHLVYDQGKMSIIGIAIAAGIGSLVGSVLMYLFALFAGRPLVIRFGPYFFVSLEKLEAAERWFAIYGSMGIFISRFVPVIRHLIGLPAGIVRMNFIHFSIYTFLGSTLWSGLLAWAGVLMARDIHQEEPAIRTLTLWAAGFALVTGGLYYFFVHRHLKK